MPFSRFLAPAVLIGGVFGAAPEVLAEQYQYQNDQGQVVASKELPPLGTTYAVLDDNGVYQYLVHSTAQLMPKIEWQVSTISEQVSANSPFSILQAPLASADVLDPGGE